jgi:hypothetical membrane protein
MSSITKTQEKVKIGELNAFVLFLSVVAIVLMLIGVVNSGTSPMLVMLPAILGAWAVSEIKGVNSSSAITLFLSLAGLAIILVGVIYDGASPWFIIFPSVVALWASSDLRG